MKKKNLIIMIALFIVGFAVGLGITLIGKDEGSKTLELTYQTNGGVPYEWKYEIKDESIVKLNKQYSEAQDDLDGGQVNEKFVFEGLKQGKTTITFKYVSITDKNVEKEETVTVKVDKNKNISLLGTD